MKFGVKPEIHGILFNGDRMVMLPWSPPSTMTKVMRWTLETFFFVGWKVEGKLCWKSVLLFFKTPCVFKLRVIAQMLILSMKVSMSELCLTGMHLLRESWTLTSKHWKKPRFSCIDEKPMLHHMTLVAWWIQGESSLTSLVCSLA